MQLILHIGLPKTATTTIQEVLEAAKPVLAARGVLYPLTTVQQTQMVDRAQNRTLIGVTGPGSLEEAVGWIADERQGCGAGTVLISSERMSLVSRNALARLDAALQAGLPGIDRVAVVAYVRDPVAWATSLCQQRLKMGTCRLADFLADPWPRSLREMLAKYVDRYGRDAVTLRHMHPDHLVNGSVTDDFLAATGLSWYSVPGPVPARNASLTLHGVQVADLLAGHLPKTMRRRRRRVFMGELLQAIDGPRFVLPRETQERIIELSRSDVDYVRATWGLDLVSSVTEPLTGQDLTEAAIEKHALAILDAVERMEGGPEEPEDEADGA